MSVNKINNTNKGGTECDLTTTHPFVLKVNLAQADGIEPPLTVLETVVLPLDQARKGC